MATSYSAATSKSIPLIVQAGSPDPKVRAAALNQGHAHREIPEPVLTLLEWDEDSDVCFAAADFRRSSQEREQAYGRLYADPRLSAHEVFRRAPYLLPKHALETSALWHEPEFRIRVAEMARYPDHRILYVLSRDAVNGVRRAVASSRDVPDSVLRELKRDGEPTVAQLAKKHIKDRRRGIDALSKSQTERGELAAWSLAVDRLLKASDASVGELVELLIAESLALPTARIIEQSWVPSRILASLVSGRDKQRQVVLTAIAAHPNTPGETLDELAHGIWGEEPALLALRNPSLPTQTLIELASTARQPGRWKLEALWANPSMPESLILSKPANVGARIGIAQNSAAPDFVLAALARDEDISVRAAVATNPAAPVDVLLKLAGNSEEEFFTSIVGALASNVRLPRIALDTLLSHPTAKVWIAQAPHTPSDVLVQLATDDDPQVRWTAASNPSTPESVLEGLSNDEAVRFVNKTWSPDLVRMTEATRRAREAYESSPLPKPSSPAEAAAVFIAALPEDERGDLVTHGSPPDIAQSEFILAALVNDPSPSVRGSVVHRAGEEVLTVLSSDPDQSVRFAVAWTTANPALLNTMSRDPYAKNAVVANPATPASVLWTFMDSSSELDLELLAQHPNATAEVLDRLARLEHSSEKVRSIIAKHPNVGPETLTMLANDGQAIVRQFVAANRRTPTSVLARLSTDDDQLVRAILALNKHTPVPTLEHLSTDPVDQVRQLIAINRRAPGRLWGALTLDADPVVRSLADENMTPAIEERRRLAADPRTAKDLLDLLASDHDPDVRRAVAANPSSPADALARLSSDVDVGIRLLVARRADATGETISKLTTDVKWSVRRTARSTQRRNIAQTNWPV